MMAWFWNGHLRVRVVTQELSEQLHKTKNDVSLQFAPTKLQWHESINLHTVMEDFAALQLDSADIQSDSFFLDVPMQMANRQ